MFNLANYLFETNAIRFCEENKPFWYTSGKIGPYFINTHFIYGSEKDAVELLSFIDEALSDKMICVCYATSIKFAKAYCNISELQIVLIVKLESQVR